MTPQTSSAETAGPTRGRRPAEPDVATRRNLIAALFGGLAAAGVQAAAGRGAQPTASDVFDGGAP